MSTHSETEKNLTKRNRVVMKELRSHVSVLSIRLISDELTFNYTLLKEKKNSQLKEYKKWITKALF